MNNRFTSALIASTAALSLAACGAPADETVDAPMVEEPVAVGTIVDVASGDTNFSTLVAAVQAAGLVDTLSGAGPFTVFAPTDAAFAKLPDGTVETLTTTDTETLGNILTYHVVAGEVNAETLIAAIEAAGADGHTIETVNGATLTATLVDGAVILTDGAGGTATVTATDVDASNGLIHVIDTVLMPA